MGKSKLRGKDLRKINYQNNGARSLAMEIMARHFKHHTKAEKLDILTNVLSNPEDYSDHEHLAKLARVIMGKPEKEGAVMSYPLLENPMNYSVYGRKFIDQNTIRQMDVAMRLPISVAGALMPDAHVGYGLPVGGVLATENAVIPYAVGLDIGCRMCLTVYDVKEEFIHRNSYQLKQALREQTHFGIGKIQEMAVEHEVLDREEFNLNEVTRQLHGKACKQIGTSGSGNHFAEFGVVEIPSDQWGLSQGKYLGILSHSGSRGFGAAVANYYTRVAIDQCHLPKGAQHLAWLDLDSAAGQEYWMAMNLAGDYAKACHDVIHHKLARAIGLRPVAKVENHHNFAWKEEQQDGTEWVVHRKGATPAQEGRMGIIPATMAAPGYIVAGKGREAALNSASHGAGRKVSRTKARQSFTGSAMKKMLKQHGITLIGGGVDEAPWAYKNLEEIMNSQQDLVEVVGAFHPKIVRMDKN